MHKWLSLLILCFFLPVVFSLKCYQCTGLPYDCQETEQLCHINQTSCMSQAFTVVDNGTIKEWTYKGCSQGLVCNESVYLDRGSMKTYISSACCSTDLCNVETYYALVQVAGLYCQSCEGSSDSCSLQNLTSVQCSGVQDRCMTVTTVFANETVSSESAIKGCGTGNLCNRSLEYNSGNGRIYTSVSCCGKTNCNTGRNSVTFSETLNGLMCYACNETGKGECKTPTTVSCTGNMSSCMDVVGFPRGNTLMRGCCSKDVCMGLSASMSIQVSQKQYCCSRNLCNNGNINSYFSKGSIIARSRGVMGVALFILTVVLRTL
ncbi:urokinase plasminogen activator surface receptor-like [Xenopus tropicalis]|uniref:Urokinase plasminogen activator surface receptor-like n=1 Tax=Xenopus tropicalis TaxID=8364 RepID=A0A6I8SLF2_XENTR|nr:urokinase plasminogen activator surface receptor-like [Xenopus tropicalis]|eukprot:XP_004916444.1 PREDICTED: urokinase plasminogen activator surface receptor-like [Xenopus tropicalis]